MRPMTSVFKYTALAAFAVVLVSLYISCSNPTGKDAYLLVTYDKNGGETDAIPKTQKINEASGWQITDLPEEPTWEGHIFVGWNTEPGGDGEDIRENDYVLSNMTLYAQWEDGLVSVRKAGDARSQTFNDLKEALDSIAGAGSYTVKIAADQTLASYSFSDSGTSVTIEAVTGKDVKITRTGAGNLFTVNNYADLTLGAGVTLDGASADGSGVNVSGYGSFTMNDGAISGFSGANSSGVNVGLNGTFTMNDGTISGNTASANNGGGAYVLGTFTMNDGTINGNTANVDGGGVYVPGNFTMNGGTINGNKASDCGGGVALSGNGTFTLDGGTISGNKAANNGGGVYLGTAGGSRTFTFTKGVISDNTAGSNGGGVYVEGTEQFTMASGTIIGNTAASGGGVYTTGIFTMNGGDIGSAGKGNSAVNGGGVWVSGDGNFTMNDGTISGNMASAAGGGVYVYSADFYKNGGTVIGYSSDSVNGNVASSGTDGQGHAIYVLLSSTIKIMDNTAEAEVQLYSFDAFDDDLWDEIIYL